MKKIKYLFIQLGLLVILTSAKAELISAELQVSGLTCSMCSKATEKSLRTLDFIQDIKVNLDQATYTLIFKKDKEVSLDLIAKKVQDAGFSVNKLAGIYEFKKVQIDNDFHLPVGKDVYHFVNTGKRTLEGQTKLVFIDKNFLPKKEFIRYSGMIHYECYKSGFQEKCCPLAGNEKKRIYHITL